jgi:hypothetical protein
MTIKPNARTSDDLLTNWISHVIVTQITTNVEPYEHLPLMLAYDERPYVLPHNMPLNYLVTNDVWFPVTNEAILTSIHNAKKTIITNAVTNAKTGKGIIFLALLVVTGIISLILITKNKNNK